MSRITNITAKLKAELQPEHLEVINESDQHAEHLEVMDGETHLRIVICSSKFEKQSLVNRHRMVTDVLKEEFDTGLHALRIQAYASKNEYLAKTGKSL